MGTLQNSTIFGFKVRSMTPSGRSRGMPRRRNARATEIFDGVDAQEIQIDISYKCEEIAAFVAEDGFEAVLEQVAGLFFGGGCSTEILGLAPRKFCAMSGTHTTVTRRLLTLNFYGATCSY